MARPIAISFPPYYGPGGPPPPIMATPQLFFTPNPFLHVKVIWTKTETTKSNLFREQGWERPRRQNFHLFPKLPLELRLMIWRYTIPSQRVIEIRSWDSTRYPFHPTKYSVAPHRPPAVLQVNQESRRESLRSYHLVEIGISTWRNHDSSQLHIPWSYHPANPNADPWYRVPETVASRAQLARPRGYYGAPPLYEPVMPYAPQKVYIDFSRDTIYLGPEFNLERLKDFLTASGPCQELRDLQYLALDRKLWLGGPIARWDNLRSALYSLRKRPVKEIYIVPDDEEGRLEDRYYYRRHRLELRQSTQEYSFWQHGAAQDEPEKTVLENLGEWFESFWEGCGREVPRVGWRSVRRDGRRMGDYRGGAWEVQRKMGNMGVWKSWVPPDDR